MRQVFITNLEPEALGEGRTRVVFQEGAADGIPDLHAIRDFNWSTVHRSDVVYVIDTHFRYRRQGHPIKLQEQGGVDVYRFLLAQFAGTGQVLRVIFYSPVAQKDLIRLKPENYVLEDLAFVHSSYSEVFQADIDARISVCEAQQWPYYNNTSENLLSGWALAYASDLKEGKHPPAIDTNGRKVVMVDDEMRAWETTMEKLFGFNGKLIPYQRGSGGNAFEIAKLGEGGIGLLEKAELVIADLYLEENHETSRWLNNEDLGAISGTRLYDEVRGTKDEAGTNPAVPYLMHTSSNKVGYYRYFHEHGVDGWLVKDVRPDAPSREKELLFKTFALEVSTRLNDPSDFYRRLKACWEQLSALDEAPTDRWWYTRCEGQHREIISSLKATWFTLRELVAHRSGYRERIRLQNAFMMPAALMNAMSMAIEAIDAPDHMRNYVYYGIRALRNCAAHWSNSLPLTVDDALLLMELVLRMLTLVSADVPRSMFRKSGYSVDWFINELHYEGHRSKPVHLANQLLLTYLQLFNYEPLEVLADFRPHFKSRAIELFHSCDRSSLLRDLTGQRPPPWSRSALLAPLVAPTMDDKCSGHLSLIFVGEEKIHVTASKDDRTPR